jgi:hypothetical protein
MAVRISPYTGALLLADLTTHGIIFESGSLDDFIKSKEWELRPEDQQVAAAWFRKLIGGLKILMQERFAECVEEGAAYMAVLSLFQSRFQQTWQPCSSFSSD